MIGEKSWAIEMNRSILVVLAVVVLLMFGAAWKMQANTQARADALAAQQAAQREAEAAREKREQEERQAAATQQTDQPNGVFAKAADTSDVAAKTEKHPEPSAPAATAEPEFNTKLADQGLRLANAWNDFMRDASTASSLPRQSLAGMLDALQLSRQQIAGIDADQCFGPVKRDMLSAADASISMFTQYSRVGNAMSAEQVRMDRQIALSKAAPITNQLMACQQQLKLVR